MHQNNITIFIIVIPLVILFWVTAFTIGILSVTKDNNYVFLIILIIGFIGFLLIIKSLFKIYNPFKKV
jgi:hypothetical protein